MISACRGFLKLGCGSKSKRRSVFDGVVSCGRDVRESDIGFSIQGGIAIDV